MARDLERALCAIKPAWEALRCQDYDTWVILDRAKQRLEQTIRYLHGKEEKETCHYKETTNEENK